MTDHIKCSFRRLCGRNTWDELQTPAQRLYYKTQALHEYCGPHLQQTIDILILPRTYHSQGLITLQWYRNVMAVTQPYQWNHEYNITQPHRREQILSLSCFLFSFSILGFLRNKTCEWSKSPGEDAWIKQLKLWSLLSDDLFCFFKSTLSNTEDG